MIENLKLNIYNIGLMVERRRPTGTPDTRNLTSEVTPLVALAPQMHNFLHYFYAGVRWVDQDLKANFPNTEHPRAEVTRFAQEQILALLQRNIEVSRVLNSKDYKDLMERQRKIKGKAAIGVIGCIDGRNPYMHLLGWTGSVSETMAGVIKTYPSKNDNKSRLRSKTIEQSISTRPQKQDSELLEICLAHEHCGAMEKWAHQGGVNGVSFSPSDNLVAANLTLFDSGILAIDRKYNSAATAAGKPVLSKVGIKAVYDPETMGLTIGYGQEGLISTGAIARKLAREYPNFHLKYKMNFNELDKFLAKERDVTDLIEMLYSNDEFNAAFASSASSNKELSGLTQNQLDAAKFVLAKITANQILTGTYRHDNANEKGDHIHPFEEHAEPYMAITIDDGLNLTVGQHDPEMQVFGASVPTVEDAVDHIVTEVSLLDKIGKAKKPYIVFISNGVTDASDEQGAMKQSRTVLATHFSQIVENKQISRLIRSGHLVPVPVIIQDRTNLVAEIPNFAL